MEQLSNQITKLRKLKKFKKAKKPVIGHQTWPFFFSFTSRSFICALQLKLRRPGTTTWWLLHRMPRKPRLITCCSTDAARVARRSPSGTAARWRAEMTAPKNLEVRVLEARTRKLFTLGPEMRRVLSCRRESVLKLARIRRSNISFFRSTTCTASRRGRPTTPESALSTLWHLWESLLAFCWWEQVVSYLLLFEKNCETFLVSTKKN